MSLSENRKISKKRVDSDWSTKKNSSLIMSDSETEKDCIWVYNCTSIWGKSHNLTAAPAPASNTFWQ